MICWESIVTRIFLVEFEGEVRGRKRTNTRRGRNWVRRWKGIGGGGVVEEELGQGPITRGSAKKRNSKEGY